MVEISNFKELSFDEARHVYKLNGVVLPSVTALMKPLSDEIYGAIDPAILQRAAERGTAVHNAIENYIKFDVTDIAPEYEGYFEAFKSWYTAHNVKPIASEVRLYHKYLLYAGTADLIAEVDGQDTLIDFKTSAAISKWLYGVQLEAYNRALCSHINTSPLMSIIVHLKSNGQHEHISYRPFDYSFYYWEVVMALLTINNFKQKMKQE